MTKKNFSELCDGDVLINHDGEALFIKKIDRNDIEKPFMTLIGWPHIHELLYSGFVEFVFTVRNESEIANACGCVGVEMGSYSNQVILPRPARMVGESREFVGIDRCIWEEVVDLWRKGISTTGCCCGHNKVAGYIGVIDEDIPNMLELGYEIAPNSCRPEDKDSFFPKSVKRVTHDN